MDEPTRTLPRVLDIALAAAALFVLSPLLLAIALAVALSSPGPVLLRQLRLGRGCKPFHMHKFRTLERGSELEETVAPLGDPRATRVGGWLRDNRLDELPQLYDVLRGRMALVGPRPELPSNLVAVDREALKRWLTVLPGVTGLTQLEFIAEDELLADTADPTHAYRTLLVPAKVRHGIDWLQSRTLAGDVAVLLRTPLVLASRRARAHSRRRVAALLHSQLRPSPRAESP